MESWTISNTSIYFDYYGSILLTFILIEFPALFIFKVLSSRTYTKSWGDSFFKVGRILTIICTFDLSTEF